MMTLARLVLVSAMPGFELSWVNKSRLLMRRSTCVDLELTCLSVRRALGGSLVWSWWASLVHLWTDVSGPCSLRSVLVMN